MTFVTGGTGFIGSNIALDWIAEIGEPVVNFDKFTYVGNLKNLASLRHDARHLFVRGDICDTALGADVLAKNKPRAIVHFAAESPIDRLILGAGDFIRTNINGMFSLLEAARGYWSSLPDDERAGFRFMHVSTDEVYGARGPHDPPFSGTTAYAPDSPYSASKAASDHLVRAYRHTYGLPVLTTNCSNNNGPYQFQEKLIPLMIVNALSGKPLPVYGDGQPVRDRLYVKDHCSCIRQLLEAGRIGEAYNVGGWNEKANLDVVHALCAILNELKPRSDDKNCTEHVTFVEDRPGHDRSYAIDATKIEREHGWRPTVTFLTGIRKTMQWHLENYDRVVTVQSGAHREWMNNNYARRPN